MNESRFIDQNKEKWREAEALLVAPVKDPDKLSNLFVQVVDDLSYARTYYPNRSVRVYLNKIARQYFSAIYGSKKGVHSQFKLFWLDELPQIILSSRRQLLVSLAVFALSLFIGAFSSRNDPQFVKTILSESYVKMTDENIKSGDPMAVYKKANQVDMFLGITLNNLMVAFRTYVLGIFLAIGTLGSLLYNGIMVGSFQYYFAEKGLLLTSSLSIWLHGTLEISSIIIAGGAGLTLGSGLIFPGTYSRIQSLQRAGIRSLKLMLGVTPLFVLAAIIESFLTRYTGVPVFLKVTLIFLSAFFIIGYFVVYPWIKSRTGFLYPLKDIQLAASPTERIDYFRIKNNADILKDTFQFYSRQAPKLSSAIFVSALIVSLAQHFFKEQKGYVASETEWWVALFADLGSIFNQPSPAFILIHALGVSWVLFATMRLIVTESNPKRVNFDLKSFVHIVFLVALLEGLLYLGAFGVVAAVIAFGYLLLSAFVITEQSSGLCYGLAHGFELFSTNKNQGPALQAILVILSFGFLLILSAPILYMHLSVLKWNFVSNDSTSQQIIDFLNVFVRTFSFYLILPAIGASMAYLCFSQEEANSASGLKETIVKMTVKRPKTNNR
ncbi:MAG TPA: stage II sporulation protein M [Chryseolinea sp.]|nr:stage II sporulation protein M [Chryseolinea sp.]